MDSPTDLETIKDSNAHPHLDTLVHFDARIKGRKEVLFGMYQECLTSVRHFEALRLTVTSIVIAASVGVSGFMAGGGLNCTDWPLSLALIVTGVYGTIFANVYFKRICWYELTADEFYAELDVSLCEPDEPSGDKGSRALRNIRVAAAKSYEDKFKQLRDLGKIELFRMFWPITITAFGVLTLVTPCVIALVKQMAR